MRKERLKWQSALWVRKEVVLFANPDFDLASTAMLAKADNGSGSIRGSEKRDVEDWSFESLTGTQKESDGNAPEALAEVQRNWLVKLRTDKGLAHAVNLAGPFIMSSQGKP